ncbi:MAG TPA: FAD-dependent oxidoreductase [Thermoanaerobaculia bacterium]|jgi:NADH dehydrogenase FAD-containing subunit|nr:FAD-dependent oxidoreductase [Thermoanaerobaculia bacterium]
MNERIVILGGGYGGALAAARLARRGVPVTLIDARNSLVERIRLHQVAAGDDVPPIPYARIFRNLPVRFLQTRVASIDRERKLINGTIPYDKLVYALGSAHAPLEPIGNARSVAVIGGGLTGIEFASEIADRHPDVKVTLVDAGIIGADLSPNAQRHLRAWFEEHGVTLIENHRVVDTPAADAVFWCTSFALSPIARESGLEVNARGQILVDDQLRSSDPDIYAIGDAADFRGRRMSCAIALPMGAYIGDLLAGATTDPFGFAFFIRCISLGRNDGIVQFVHGDDTPKDLCLTGRTAAWVKELICRFTVMSIRLESRGIHYRWPKMEAA